MEQKFAKDSLLVDVLPTIILYVIHAALICIATTVLNNFSAFGIVYLIICAVITLVTKTDRSSISNWILRILLSPVIMPFSLSRRIRPYIWLGVIIKLIPEMSDEEVKAAYDRLSSANRRAQQLHEDPQWKNKDFDFLGIKDDMIWGCRTWGEAENTFEYIEKEMEERTKKKG